MECGERSCVAHSCITPILFHDCGDGRSREVYHTKRMQRVGCVEWTRDSKYVISASDEMNIRLWKAVAWEKLGKVSGQNPCHAI